MSNFVFNRKFRASKPPTFHILTVSIYYTQKNSTMNKRIFDIIFMIISTIILVILLEYGFLEEYIGFALIPILIAYQLGQYSERKFKK